MKEALSGMGPLGERSKTSRAIKVVQPGGGQGYFGVFALSHVLSVVETCCRCFEELFLLSCVLSTRKIVRRDKSWCSPVIMNGICHVLLL